jgi:predicted membrane protein
MAHIHRTNKRIFFGLFLIVLGLLWIMERLDMIPDELKDVLISWQMLLIGIGVFSMIGGNRTTGLILILIGGFFLVPDMFQVPYEFRRIFWPLLLVCIGVILLFRHRHKEEPVFVDKSHSTDYFDEFVVFGGREIFVNSNNFLGGKTTSIFGGSEFDLRRTVLSPNGAVIDCLSLFGGCTFKVPPEWTIKNEMNTIFGAFTDKRGATFRFDNTTTTDHSKMLVIKGFSAFGGVEIKLV